MSPWPLLLALALCASPGDEPPPSERSEPRDQQLVHDLGEIPMREQWEGSGELHNGGEECLWVRSISTTCGCLEVDVGTEAIFPGEALPFTLSIHLAGRFGAIQERATFYLEAEDRDPTKRRVVEVTVRAHIRPAVTWKPVLLPVRDLAQGEARHIQIEGVLDQADAPPVSLVPETGATWGPGALTLRREGANLRLSLRLEEARLPPMESAGRVEIPLRLGGSEERTSRVTVAWNRRPSLVAAPPYLVWASALTAPTSTQVRLSHVAKRPFQVLEVQSPAGFQGVATPRADGDWDLRVSRSSGATPPPGESIRILTDDPWLPWITLPLSVSP